jgi:hypothetical protein
VKATISVRVGGIALILGAIAFLAVFSFLAARFDYPAILDGPVAAVNNYLLPLWMIVFGVVLLRHHPPDTTEAP